MKAFLATYTGEFLTEAREIEIDDEYDGDPWGEYVHMSVGSNQAIVVEDDHRWDLCSKLALEG